VIHWLAFLLIVANLALPLSGSLGYAALPGSVRQSAVTIEDLGVTYQAGSSITFNARIRSDEPVQDVMLFVTPAGQPASMVTVNLDSDQEVHHEIETYVLGLRPFTLNHFHFLVALQNGEIIPSNQFAFQYEDNRFPWQSLINTDFEVWWYGRDASFGGELLTVARQGLDSASEILMVDPPAPIRIYAYDSSRDLQSALSLNQSWIVGHAAPDLGQMYLYIPKGAEQRLEIERQVPHEIMHFLQYQQSKESLRHQPVWLMEGMASLAELYPNPEYQRVLRATADRRELLSMASLCSSFPREASGAFQAYAQSASFVRFLHQNYGNTGLEKLMEQYNNGQGCDEGLASALGVSLSQLEYRWKQEYLGIDAGYMVLRNLSPYMLLLVLVAFPVLLVLFPYNRLRKAASQEPAAGKP
jgi:hypothetical protein